MIYQFYRYVNTFFEKILIKLKQLSDKAKSCLLHRLCDCELCDDNISYSSLTSGKPATLVNTDNMPASSEAEPTTSQLTSPITADVPIVATAVCATVLTALTAAAFAQFFQFLIFSPPFNFCLILQGRQFYDLQL